MRESAGVRRAGAAALDLAYVACGRLDAFWEMGLSRWDMAAGALLIQEAGGLVGDLGGGAEHLERGEIAAGTPKVLPQLLEALR
jgi:myo-inositol-1(or 4)-monophosphatase